VDHLPVVGANVPGLEADVTVVFESGTGDYLCVGVGTGSKTSFKADKTYKAVKNPAPESCPAYVAY
jgi:hypothetical protein